MCCEKNRKFLVMPTRKPTMLLDLVIFYYIQGIPGGLTKWS